MPAMVMFYFRSVQSYFSFIEWESEINGPEEYKKFFFLQVVCYCDTESLAEITSSGMYAGIINGC